MSAAPASPTVVQVLAYITYAEQDDIERTLSQEKFVEQEDPEGSSKIDAVSILSFASLNDIEDYPVSNDQAAIAQSEVATRR